MHELYELKDKLCKELEKYAGKEITVSSLEYVDKLAHAIKNIDKILETSDSEYSGRMYPMPYYSRDGHMMHDGMSYARGRTGNVRRDAMGRYSSASAMVDELRELREDAPDERTRMEFDRFIKKMETM